MLYAFKRYKQTPIPRYEVSALQQKALMCTIQAARNTVQFSLCRNCRQVPERGMEILASLPWLSKPKLLHSDSKQQRVKDAQTRN